MSLVIPEAPNVTKLEPVDIIAAKSPAMTSPPTKGDVNSVIKTVSASSGELNAGNFLLHKEISQLSQSQLLVRYLKNKQNQL